MNRFPLSRRALLLALFATATYAARAQNIGVGTLIPGEKLDVVGGNIRIKDSGRVLIFPDGTTQGTAASGTGFIQNTTTQQAGSSFNVSGNGTIGGSETVAGSSTVAGAVQAGTTMYVDAAGGNTGSLTNALRFGASGTGSGEGIGSKRSSGGNQSGLDFYTSFANRMSITNGGNVGIGTTNPATNLDVRTADNSAAITVGKTDGTAGALYFGNPGHGVKRNYSGVNDVGLYTTAANLYLAANGAVTNQFVLTNAGNVGIGTNPATALDVASGAGTQLTLTSTAGDPNGVISINVPTTNTGCAGCSELISFSRPGLGLGSISMNTASNGVVYATTSDKRLKEHIGRTRFGLADLMRLEVKDYNFIGQPASSRVTGFLAQDLFKVYPDAVKEGDYGTTVTNQWAVDYGKLTPLLVQAIQDQQQQIEALKAQNTALQSGSAADHASLLTLQAQMARLLGEGAQAQK